MATHTIDGPYFEDFHVGQSFSAPSITLTAGHASAYQALTADRMRLPLDHELSRRVTGNECALAHPHLVINIANGQTTYPSQHVKGNLFYRGLLLRKPVFIGDTLSTTTTVVGLRQNQSKAGRAATGMVALEMQTVDQNDQVVMHYWRCPMIPCKDPAATTDCADDFSTIPENIPLAEIESALPRAWDIRPLISDVTGLKADRFAVGDLIRITPQDTITCAPELVRLTLNIAYAHTDATKSYLDKRLVYGGHTISLALAQITRAFPAMITVIAWQACSHTAPVLENDIIRTQVKVNAIHPLTGGGELVDIHAESFAQRLANKAPHDEGKVLDWQLTIWNATA